MPLIRFNPQLAVPRFDRFFDNFWDNLDIESPTLTHGPKVDIEELDQHFELHVALPGLDKKDINIAVEDGVLTISGPSQNEALDEGRRFHLREIHRDSFSRRFNLGDAIDAQNIQAEMHNGILNITLGKQMPSESEKRKQIEIR
ncbi:MAG: Hsp20/alpha crystallin family protein [Myxococcota bacterium]|nr:Hsp20/alpha crystallin family protein [Myxococcota bacterium]